MKHIYEPRDVFLTVSICIAFSSLLLIFIIPKAIAKIADKSEGVWDIFVPEENYYVYGVGFLLLFIAALIPFLLDVNKLSIILCITCLLLSTVSFFTASQSFKSISDDTISYRTLFTKHVQSYSSDEIKSVHYSPRKDKQVATYKFIFTDGSSMTIDEDGYLFYWRNRLQKKLREYGIKIE